MNQFKASFDWQTDKRNLSSWLSLVAVLGALQFGCAYKLTESEHRKTKETMSSINLVSGDKIQMTINSDEMKITKTFMIDPRGNVAIPGFGIIHIAGLTPAEASAQLDKRYSEVPNAHLGVHFEVTILNRAR